MAINALSMSSALSASGMTIDAEHQRIMRALIAYGVEPTGDKSVDYAKLQKIETSKNNQNAQLFLNSKNNEQKSETTDSNALVDKGQGTEQLAMLNKFKLGLL